MERAEGSELFQALANLMNSAPFNLLSGAARESLKKKKKRDENGTEEGHQHSH